jgi:energy-coupling factor transport system ATP-binding protein
MKVTVAGVTFAYPSGVVALRDVSLTLPGGEATALIGANGAGKTTLARHLNGLLKPDRGRVLVGDWDTCDHSVARLAQRVGYAFQNPDEQLFASTVAQEVAFGPRNLGRSDEEVERTVARALHRVGLADARDEHPYDLPLSQRRLVSLAAVVAMDTAVVVLDEPTTGQDARDSVRIGAIVEDLKAEGRNVIAISHDIEFCGDHFERIVVMEGGRILADGPAARILAQVGLLAQADVVPPQLVRLALELGWRQPPLTMEGFLAMLAQGKQD